MNNWVEIKLGKIAMLSKRSWKVGDSHFPYVGLEHIGQGTLRLNGIGDPNSVSSNKYLFSSDEFLFGKLRPYFRKVIRPKFNGICSTDIWVVKNKENTSKDFLFYLFSSKDFVDLAFSGSSGTRMPRANWDFMKETTWLIPQSLEEQKAIAAVLSSLDDKIDLLQRQNKTFESLAQTLFRQWFIEEAQDDWEEGVLPDEFDFTMGASPPGKSYNEEGIGIPMFQGNADFEFRFPRNRVYTIEPKRFAKKHDTLISVRAPVGAQNMSFEDCCIGRGVAAFRYKHENSFYTYTYFKLRSLMDEIRQFNDEGTVFGSISKKDLSELSIIIPPKEKVIQFQEIVKPIDDKVITNTIQIHTLEKLRDILLPKLMSGEMRVCYEQLPIAIKTKREAISETFLPWLQNEWLAILEVIYRISKQPFANPVGETIIQKLCYVMTEELGLKTNLDFEKSTYGPFSKQVTPILNKLINQNLLERHQLGKMKEISTTKVYEETRNNFLTNISNFEESINKTVDLFCRIKKTQQAEEVATVLYAARQLKIQNPEKTIFEQEVMDYVLEWKPKWNRKRKLTEVAITIRNLQILNWLKLEFSESLPNKQ